MTHLPFPQAIGANREDCQKLKSYAEQVKIVVADACKNSKEGSLQRTGVPAEFLKRVDSLKECVHIGHADTPA